MSAGAPSPDCIRKALARSFVRSSVSRRSGRKRCPTTARQRQQDADQQRRRVTGFLGDRFVHFAHAPAILPCRWQQYRDRYRQLRAVIDPGSPGDVAQCDGVHPQFEPRSAEYDPTLCALVVSNKAAELPAKSFKHFDAYRTRAPRKDDVEKKFRVACCHVERTTLHDFADRALARSCEASFWRVYQVTGI